MMISTSLFNNILGYQIKNNFYSFLIKAFEEINPDKEFLSNWHIRLCCDALSDNNTKRLIVNIPPRYLKSICFSVAFPCWYIGNNPSARIIVTTYSNLLSTKHATDAKRIMRSSWYKKIFPEARIVSGFDRQLKFGTETNGYYFATSIGGTLTGEGGDIIIVDDPHNPAKIHSIKERKKIYRWTKDVLFSRLNNKETGRIIIIMQRLHQDDLVGNLLNQENSWEHICLPVLGGKDEVIKFKNKIYHMRKKYEPLHIERENADVIDTILKDLGERVFMSQYQQKPHNESSGFIKKQWFKYFKKIDFKNLKCFISIDCAIEMAEKSDYSVIVVIALDDIKNEHYIIDVVRIKESYIDLKSVVKSIIEKYVPEAVLIEDRAVGSALLREMKTLYNNIIGISPKNDKITRFSYAVMAIESGIVFLPENGIFIEDFIDELISFPFAEYDDQVDVISQYFKWISEKFLHSPRVRFL